MRIKYIYSILFVMLAFYQPISAHKAGLDTLYQQLDQAIAHSEEFVAKREEKINLVKSQLKNANSDDLRYQLTFQLYELYRPYISWEAISYLNQCVDLSKKSGDAARMHKDLALLAVCCISTGYYDEARLYLQQVDKLKLNKEGLGIYYRALYLLNNELAYYSPIQGMKDFYLQEKEKYEQMMLNELPANDDVVFETRELRLLSEGKGRECLDLNAQWLKKNEGNSNKYALVALFRYLSYKAVNDTTQMMRWVALSALSDVKEGVLDQGSMWEIANQMMLQGDVDRAYRYISFTSECAKRFGSRQRSWQIAPLLSDIADKYKKENEKNTHRLVMATVAVSLLFIISLLLLFYTRRQRNKLSAARNQLASINDQLKTLNTQLEQSNSQLADSNRVKEEYIGRFLSLCCLYIDRMDEMRKQTLRLVKNKQFEELYRKIKNDNLRTDDLDELYENFDSAFIHLFPDFVDRLNALLKPEAQLELPEEGKLTTTIRIFALIRLGIEDSSKIAEFLHYSVNTIYNYRARLKNGALENRYEFEERVKEIGLQ